MPFKKKKKIILSPASISSDSLRNLRAYKIYINFSQAQYVIIYIYLII